MHYKERTVVCREAENESGRRRETAQSYSYYLEARKRENTYHQNSRARGDESSYVDCKISSFKSEGKRRE